MDKREEILNNIQSAELKVGDEIYTASEVKEAMDVYMKATCLELLEYMAKNEVLCVNTVGDKRFYYKGVFISSEELFENFL